MEQLSVGAAESTPKTMAYFFSHGTQRGACDASSFYICLGITFWCVHTAPLFPFACPVADDLANVATSLLNRDCDGIAAALMLYPG